MNRCLFIPLGYKSQAPKWFHTHLAWQTSEVTGDTCRSVGVRSLTEVWKSEAFTEPCCSHQHGCWLANVSLLEHLAQLAGSYTRVSSSLAIDHCLYDLGQGTFAFYFLNFLSLIASIFLPIGGNRYVTCREGSHGNCRFLKTLFWWDIYLVF